MEKRLKTFEDLAPFGGFRLQAVFDNGYGVSVIPRDYLKNIFSMTDSSNSVLEDSYQDSEEMFELVIIMQTGEDDFSIVSDTPVNEIYGDILILNEAEVNEIMKEVQNLPKWEI
ncbi:MAG: hypothetical protein OHK0057_13100 [Thermoflexibacter sp.]